MENNIEFYSTVKQRFALPESEGRNKVCSLKEAVKKYIKPRMALLITQTGVRWPTAAIFEIARQFWAQNLNFPLLVFQ
jgi:hypothetical protein